MLLETACKGCEEGEDVDYSKNTEWHIGISVARLVLEELYSYLLEFNIFCIIGLLKPKEIHLKKYISNWEILQTSLDLY